LLCVNAESLQNLQAHGSFNCRLLVLRVNAESLQNLQAHGSSKCRLLVLRAVYYVPSNTQ